MHRISHPKQLSFLKNTGMKWWWVGILLLGSFISTSQTITTFAGCGTSCTGSIGDGGPAIDAIILDPNGGSFDRYGNYYFAEPTGGRIRKINTDGIITTVAGGGSGSLGDGNLATLAVLNEPTTVLVDTFGNLYIADAGNYRVRKVDFSTGIIHTICGNGVEGFSNDGGLADTTQLSIPDNICFDKFGNLYVADQVNLRVRKINTAGIISTFAGSGGFSVTGTGDGGIATAATFNFIAGVTSDDTGNIYIADYNAGKVRKVDTFGIIHTIAGNGTPTYMGDGVPAIEAQIAPVWLGFNDTGNLFIADKYNRRVYKIDNAGVIHSIAGNGMTGYGGDGGTATTASLDFPAGISFDACGNLYIPDVNNKRIRKVTFNTGGTPSVTIAATADTVCAGTSVTYSASVTGSSTFSYKWIVNGTEVSDTGSSYTYTPLNGDSVRCIFIGTGQCSGDADTVSSNILHMMVTPLITPTISVTSPATAIPDSAVTVTATVANAGSGYSIKWYDNDVLFATTSANTATCTVTTGTNSITATVVPVSGS